MTRTMFKNSKGKARPKPAARTPKGEATRQRALHAALALFRRKGFGGTTMRDIAKEAGLSLGAAYHYFPSKDALVMDYYEWLQTEHERRAGGETPEGADVATRLRVLLRTKLDLLARDRKILAALFRNIGDPAHPLSVFSRQTETIRRRSIAQFEEACASLPAQLRQPVGLLAWFGHLALILLFLHDRSRGQARTRALADEVAGMAAGALPLLAMPFAAPALDRFLDVARAMGLEGIGGKEGKDGP
jgi:AcrR family transcriptional regulator